jgi:hypothetical protein
MLVNCQASVIEAAPARGRERRSSFEDLGGCLPAEDLARPGVERSSDGFDLLGAPPQEVGALREHWRKRPLVFSFVACCQGYAVIDEHRNVSVDLEGRVRGELLASVPRQ